MNGDELDVDEREDDRGDEALDDAVRDGVDEIDDVAGVVGADDAV